jgi:hypothetical protein
MASGSPPYAFGEVAFFLLLSGELFSVSAARNTNFISTHIWSTEPRSQDPFPSVRMVGLGWQELFSLLRGALRS